MSDFLILDEEVKDSSTWQKQDNKWWDSSKAFYDKINDYFISMQKVKTKDKVVFYRLLSTMTNAWMSLVKSISILEKQEKNETFKRMLAWFCEDLRWWKNLSVCMLDYPSSFTEAEIWIIKSWEKTWQLNSSLKDLADQLEKINWINWKIVSAMIYPAVILMVVIWVIAVMMILVVPKLLAIFAWNPEWLPASTQLLIAISDAFVNYWYIMLIVTIWFVVFIKVWSRTPDWHYMLDVFKLKVPVFWALNQKLILSKFARVFSWLVWSGVSIVESLKIVSDAVWNEVYKQRLLLLGEDISWGIKMWESLDGDKLFPDMMVQMIQVWEQTAKLDSTVLKVADFYEEQVDNIVWSLNKLLEPFIIVTLAIIVWFIAIAIMQPIMNMADTVSWG